MDNNQFAHHFSEESRWKKIKTYSSLAGVTVVYGALFLVNY